MTNFSALPIRRMHTQHYFILCPIYSLCLHSFNLSTSFSHTLPRTLRLLTSRHSLLLCYLVRLFPLSFLPSLLRIKIIQHYSFPHLSLHSQIEPVTVVAPHMENCGSADKRLYSPSTNGKLQSVSWKWARLWFTHFRSLTLYSYTTWPCVWQEFVSFVELWRFFKMCSICYDSLSQGSI